MSARKLRGWFVLLAVTMVVGLTAAPAQACPSCKAANATDNRLPLAFQASILFMLAVPTVLVSGLGVMLYRMNKLQVAAAAAFENGDVWLGEMPQEMA